MATIMERQYPELYNKPSINGIQLLGDKTSEELGFQEADTMTEADIDAALGWS